MRWDDSHWPRFVLVRVHGRLTRADFDTALSWHRGVLARGRRYYCLTRLRRGTTADAALRTHMGREFATTNVASAKWISGSVVVLESPLVRGLMTAINRINPAPHPQQFCSSVDRGMGHLSDYLRGDGQPELSSDETVYIGSFFSVSALETA